MLQIVLRLILATVAIGLPLATAYQLYRRYRIPLPLLAVGALTYSSAFLVQTILAWLFDNPLLQAPLPGALFIGIIIGFTDIGTRFWGYYSIARHVVYRPQAVMIGTGHALPRMLFNGLLVILWGMSDGEGVSNEAELLEIVTGLVATIAPMLLHSALSWMVLQTFLRNEIAWSFEAVFLAGMVFGTEAFITNTTGEPEALLIILWGLVAAGSGWLLWAIEPPADFVWRP